MTWNDTEKARGGGRPQLGEDSPSGGRRAALPGKEGSPGRAQGKSPASSFPSCSQRELPSLSWKPQPAPPPALGDGRG